MYCTYVGRVFAVAEHIYIYVSYVCMYSIVQVRRRKRRNKGHQARLDRKSPVFGTPAYSELTKFTPIFLKIENYILTTTHHKNTNQA